MTLKFFLSPIFLSILIYQCLSESVDLKEDVPDYDDPKEILYRELSTDAYFNLPCHTDSVRVYRRLGSDTHSAYKHMNKSEWDFENKNSQPAAKPPAEVVDRDRFQSKPADKSIDTLNPDAFTIFHLCYAVSSIWRRGRKSIHRYYMLRDTYVDHLPFEIGYMTHAIMVKYQNVLELYEYSTRMEGPENKIGRPHLFFFYKNILEDCRTIMHLCNMMHEVTRKYRILQYSEVGKPWIDVPYDESKKFQDRAGNWLRFRYAQEAVTRNFERGIEGHEHERYRHEDPAIFDRVKKIGALNEEEADRLYQKAKPIRQHFFDFGRFPANKAPTSRPTRFKN